MRLIQLEISDLGPRSCEELVGAELRIVASCWQEQ